MTMDELHAKVGRIALLQAEIDEYLVEAFIAILNPDQPNLVEVLVGKYSLPQKISTLRQLLEARGYDLDSPIGAGTTVRQLLSDIKRQSEARDSAVHAVYREGEPGQYQRFRTRNRATPSISLEELDSLAGDLESLLRNLQALVEELHLLNQPRSEAEITLADTLRAVHELILAGHSVERGRTSALQRSRDAGSTLRMRAKGPRLSLLEDGEQPATDEALVEVNTQVWLAEVTMPDGQHYSLGDTGWRDVTAGVQEDDPDVTSALVRRVNDRVTWRVDGGTFAESASQEQRDRLAERAFGKQGASFSDVPPWFSKFPGFTPNSTGSSSQRGSGTN